MNFKAVYNSALQIRPGDDEGYMRTLKKGNANVIEFYNPMSINTGQIVFN